MNRFECPTCGWVSIPPPHVKVVFHPCRPYRRRRRLVRLPEVEDVTTEEARSAVWEALADAVPIEDRWRRLT